MVESTVQGPGFPSQDKNSNTDHVLVYAIFLDVLNNPANDKKFIFCADLVIRLCHSGLSSLLWLVDTDGEVLSLVK